MSHEVAQQSRVRSIQLLMLVIGGGLILFGGIRSTYKDPVDEGYKALWGGSPGPALEHFDRALQASPAKVEARIGRSIAQSLLGRLSAAEADWNYLLAPGDDGKDEPRLDAWRKQDTRSYYRYEGCVFYAQMLLSGDGLLRAFRREDPADEIDRAQSRFSGQRQQFLAYIERLTSGQGSSEADMWRMRFKSLDERIARGERVSDTQAAQDLMTSGTRNPFNEKPDTIRAMLDPYLNRAVAETPTRMSARAWHLLALASLMRQDARISGGGDAAKALSDALANAKDLSIQPKAVGDGVDRARLHLGIAHGLRELARKRPDEAQALRELEREATAAARAIVNSMSPQNDDFASLDAMLRALAE